MWLKTMDFSIYMMYKEMGPSKVFLSTYITNTYNSIASLNAEAGGLLQVQDELMPEKHWLREKPGRTGTYLMTHYTISLMSNDFRHH